MQTKKILFPFLALLLWLHAAYSQHMDIIPVPKKFVTDSGIVFINFKYIRSPYIVEIRKTGLFVNGIRVKSSEFKLPELPPSDQDVDVPPGISKDMGMEGFSKLKKGKWTLIDLKYRYVFAHYPEEVGKDTLVAFFKKFPFIKSMKMNGSWHLILEDYYGKSLGVELKAVEHTEPAKTQADVYKEVNQYFKIFTDYIQNDGVLFLTNTSSIYMSDESAVSLLSEFLQKHKSLQDIDQKYTDFIGKTACETMKKNFVYDKQLEEKVARLRKKVQEWKKKIGGNIVHLDNHEGTNAILNSLFETEDHFLSENPSDFMFGVYMK